MRKLLFLALFLILLHPLFSLVTYPEGIPGEERGFLDMAFFEAVDGRKDVPIMVTGYELGDDRGVLSFSIEGKEFSISARDRDEMVRYATPANVSQYFTMGEREIQIRTSGYCRFADLEIDPEVLAGTRTIDATGVLTIYQGNIQFVLLDQTGIKVNE